MLRRHFFRLAAACFILPALRWVPWPHRFHGKADNGNWNDPGNWQYGRMPSTGDDVVIESGALLFVGPVKPRLHLKSITFHAGARIGLRDHGQFYYADSEAEYKWTVRV